MFEIGLEEWVGECLGKTQYFFFCKVASELFVANFGLLPKVGASGLSQTNSVLLRV